MIACFKTIVVALDFNSRTDAEIQKALAYSSPDAVLYLVHVQNPLAVLPVVSATLKWPALGFFKMQAATGRAKLRNVRKQILAERPNAKVRLMLVRAGPVKEVVLEKARRENADLIIIGKSRCRGWLSFWNPPLAALLVKKAPCAVLMVTAGVPEHAMETVILPVFKTVTYNTLGVMAALSKRHRLHIHLVTFTGESLTSESMPAALLRVYQWLKTSLQCQVQYKALPRHHKTEAMLAYAEAVHADVLLVDPERLVQAGWWRKHYKTLLQPQSRVSILAVQPTGNLVIE